jgi:hypothetical protein
MKIEAHVLLVIGAFFGLAGLIYWIWSYAFSSGSLSTGAGGSAMLAGSCALGIVPGLYYLWWSKRMKPRAEDRHDAKLEDGAGVVGSFPSSSIWPFLFGLSATLVALALVFGFWTAAIGFVLAIASVIGYVFESRRGGLV